MTPPIPHESALGSALDPALDPTVCERARLSRDPRFDGAFFVGVLSTGIYCRPICPVQPPKPDNVRFFASAAAAEDAGLRPCLRCRPECSPSSPAWGGTGSTVRRALRLIDEGTLDAEGCQGLARRLGIGERHLRRLFARHLGASPASVARTRRLLLAKQLIDTSDLPMTQVALAAGYGSVRRFNAAVRHDWGRTPTQLRDSRTGRRAQAAGASRPVPHAIELRLGYVAPCDFASLLAFLAPRAIPGVAIVDEGRYRRTFDIGGTRGWLEVEQPQGENALIARIHPERPGSLLPIAERLRQLFDLHARPADIAAVLGHDPILGSCLRQKPGLRVPGAWDGFEIAVRAILGQQVTVRGATTLAARFVERWGTPLHAGSLPEETLREETLPAEILPPGLNRIFPRPNCIAALAGKELTKAIGIPVARATALLELARAIEDGRVDLSGARGSEVLVDQLTTLPGIGTWTAQYIAMRALGDPDAFPAGDLGLRNALADGVCDRHPSEQELLQQSEAWRPWRAYAAMLLWQVALPGRNGC